jgi:multiple sugar transport system permease protein
MVASVADRLQRVSGRRDVPMAIRRKRLLVAVADHSLLIAASIMFLAPFVFIAMTALMTDNQALSARLWPEPFRLANFSDLFTKQELPVIRYTRNTMMYAVLSSLGMLLSSVPAAYALARLRWRGRNVVFVLVIAMMLLPRQVTIVPLYLFWKELNLTGTLWPLILPNWFGDAFSIFLLRQFFLTIPEEYADAARVDGAGEFRIMVTIVARMAKPALAAVLLFSFLFAWNDFFGPLLYTGEQPANWPLAVGLSQFRSIHHVQWNITMAATLLFMAPVIILFFFAQKSFIEGVTLTGVKG